MEATPSGGAFVNAGFSLIRTGLGLATATTSATFFPHFEQRVRVASFASVTDLPAILASASGSLRKRRLPMGRCYSFAERSRGDVKRGTTALAVLSVCVLPGCGTQPPKLEYADGPGPYNFDCNAKAGYYDDLNIHAPNGKLRLAGFVQVDSVAARPDPRWITQTEVFLLGPTLTPFVSLWGFVTPDAPDKVNFALRYGLRPSDAGTILPEKTTPIFAEARVGDPPIAFELTINESRQLMVSVGGAAKTIAVPQFDVTRAHFTCSGTHARYSYVTVTAE